ncbi:MAG: helix-turn-helix domain-containing protein [Solirubrobacteraceae bacterium]
MSATLDPSLPRRIPARFHPADDREIARGVRLLDVEPDLGVGLTEDDFETARRQVVLPAVSIGRGRWPIERLASAKGVRGEVQGFLLLDGLMTMDATVAGRACSRLLGPGELVLAQPLEADSLSVEWSWSALTPARVAVLDLRLALIGCHWPKLMGAIIHRAGRQTCQGMLQQAVSQLPRVEDRLLALFWSIADRHGVVRADGVWLRLPVTHDVLARMIGARRPTVTLGLQSLAARGLLHSTGDGWLLAPGSLDRLVPLVSSAA